MSDDMPWWWWIGGVFLGAFLTLPRRSTPDVLQQVSDNYARMLRAAMPTPRDYLTEADREWVDRMMKGVREV